MRSIAVCCVLALSGCGGPGSAAVVGQLCEADGQWRIEVYTTEEAEEVAVDLVGKEEIILEEEPLPSNIPECILEASTFSTQSDTYGEPAFLYARDGVDLGPCDQDNSSLSSVVRVTWVKDDASTIEGSSCQ